ncbi:hypothetical protein P8C59_003032 [Phyllachora maydis]|uniref:J domain-containing protein n=1 Tax=Phyllachora maydis TaxID=1825666 RepID=A0AAD9HZE4_9PEZI|nr:hypothetical protein P8C59_003032 [Phyllachora maydis]
MSAFLSFLGWSFLPDLVTGWVQTLYYAIVIRAGDPKPRRGTPRFAVHRRRIQILVVTLYLAYTLVEADYQVQRAGSFYTLLGVPLDASERDVKARFRRLAALHHPDKVVGAGPAAADVNALFIRLKTAADVLADPARRFAYERLGPDAAVDWHGGGGGGPATGRCVTVRDFVLRGLRTLLPYYAGAAVSMYGLSLLGYLNWGRYERWLAMALMLLFEYSVITRPGRPAVLDRLVNPLMAMVPGRPPYLPFQAVTLARKAVLTVCIAFEHLGPLLRAETKTGQVAVAAADQGGDKDQLLRQGLDRLEAVALGLHMDSRRLLETEMVPYAGDAAMVASMRSKVQEWLVQNTIRSDPLVRDALGRSLQKSRVDAPAGARGT